MDKIIINRDFILRYPLKISLFWKLIFFSLLDLNYEYPNFKSWLEKSFLGIIEGNRSIILYLTKNEKEVIAISILKHDEYQKKICTFRVSNGYRQKSIGTRLMDETLLYLNLDKPLITVSESHYKEFAPFLKKFNFRLYEKMDSLYKPYIIEYIFNDTIEPDRELQTSSYEKKCSISDKAILCR